MQGFPAEVFSQGRLADRQDARRSRLRTAWQTQRVASTFELSGCDRPVDDFLKPGAHSCGEPLGAEDVDGEAHELVL